jgi:cobalt-precorrin-5B (C1)-methyltransferase
MEILAGYAAFFGAPRELVGEILTMTTTEMVLDRLETAHIAGLYPFIADRVSKKCMQHVHGELRVGTIIFSQKKGLLAMDDIGMELMETFR